MPLVKAIIYTLIVFTLIYYAIKKKDSDNLYQIIMFFCWVVIALSMDSYDISNYRAAYDYGLFRKKEPLFDLLQWVFSSIGVPFSVFKLAYGTVIWVLLYKAFQNFTANKALAAVMFVIGPMMGFGTQMRSSMAGAIVIYSLPLLLKKDEKIWKYCALVALASLFHLMAVFYFVFLIPRYVKIRSEKFRNILCIIALALIPFLLLFSGLISQLFGWMQTITDIGIVNTTLARFQQYFSGSMSPNIKGFLFSACGHFAAFYLTDRACSAMLYLRNRKEEQNEDAFLLSRYAITYLRKLNSIMVLFIPCYLLSMQFDRFFGYFVPIGYCLIAQGSRELSLVTKKRFAGQLELVLLFACLLFCFFVNNRFTEQSEFVRIINGIALFGFGI